ncbi:hypothetical protein D081_2019 [Anaerovibrio sp. JC8]|uniref:AAA family ATPase n=1 Tax=Anaerovibrio sp. JC8 TaxID=1240085 RepID=UPI000A0EA44D|nr:ATP-binding protein [Anaerovibrio sp. JC8]ORT99290.1 hypothetical protein D081_2019 [Anaerovibrio sp. JC8]
MLQQFSVENFRSFKNKAVLSMEASADKNLLDNIVQMKKDRVLKVAAIFGANAAGKSNLFFALTAAILMVRFSNFRQIGEPLTQITPFLFDKESGSKPTSFEFVFTVNEKKYVYGFSATTKKICTEYLYVYNSSKPATIFVRDESEKEPYRFTDHAIQKKLKPLTERNTDNKLFLATASSWNAEETKEPMLWFMQGINTYEPRYEEKALNLAGNLYENDEDKSLRNFTINLLKEADINISDYNFTSKEIPFVHPGQFAPKQEVGTDQQIQGKVYEITAFHTIGDDNGHNEKYSLGMHSESQGTRNLFFMAPIIKRAFDTGETVCIDEFDTSLHPMLLVYVVGLFNNPNINKRNAQLIISSHTMSLLDLNEMRRDQIYFVEKNQQTGISDLYSLDEFSPRTREDIRKAYLLGRYGSIPEVGAGGSLWG